ncbi:hypothetical protein [Spongiactinospora sp. 9N601]|uniref:hypothetical protein n=1 Tax=Spongiactinospora sp. 9N601 TaxID=3375149 RepID=UPI0037978837
MLSLAVWPRSWYLLERRRLARDAASGDSEGGLHGVALPRVVVRDARVDGPLVRLSGPLDAASRRHPVALSSLLFGGTSSGTGA